MSDFEIPVEIALTFTREGYIRAIPVSDVENMTVVLASGENVEEILNDCLSIDDEIVSRDEETGQVSGHSKRNRLFMGFSCCDEMPPSVWAQWVEHCQHVVGVYV